MPRPVHTHEQMNHDQTNSDRSDHDRTDVDRGSTLRPLKMCEQSAPFGVRFSQPSCRLPARETSRARSFETDKTPLDKIRKSKIDSQQHTREVRTRTDLWFSTPLVRPTRGVEVGPVDLLRTASTMTCVYCCGVDNGARASNEGELSGQT